MTLNTNSNLSQRRRKLMGDDLVWMDLTSLAEEKYPDPKENGSK